MLVVSLRSLPSMFWLEPPGCAVKRFGATVQVVKELSYRGRAAVLQMAAQSVPTTDQPAVVFAVKMLFRRLNLLHAARHSSKSMPPSPVPGPTARAHGED